MKKYRVTLGDSTNMMTMDEFNALLMNGPKHQSLEVDANLFSEMCQKQITYHYDEDKEGTQKIELYVRNGHIVYKGTELILNNQA